MSGPYEDIIKLPHHISAKRPHMDVSDRAAQFSAFAALAGHDTAMKETARLTEDKSELDEDAKSVLDMKLHVLSERIRERPEISITYFKKDIIKAGGSYENVKGFFKKIDKNKGILIMEDEHRIAIDDIREIECDIFCSLFDVNI